MNRQKCRLSGADAGYEVAKDTARAYNLNFVDRLKWPARRSRRSGTDAGYDVAKDYARKYDLNIKEKLK